MARFATDNKLLTVPLLPLFRCFPPVFHLFWSPKIYIFHTAISTFSLYSSHIYFYIFSHFCPFLFTSIFLSPTLFIVLLIVRRPPYNPFYGRSITRTMAVTQHVPQPPHPLFFVKNEQPIYKIHASLLLIPICKTRNQPFLQRYRFWKMLTPKLYISKKALLPNIQE